MGEKRKLHKSELHNLYSNPNIIRQIKSRRMRWAKHVAHMGKEREVYKVLVGKLKVKGTLGRLRYRQEDAIKMDLRKTSWEVEWIQLAQDRNQWQALLNMVT
jgi:hypothetical protein